MKKEALLNMDMANFRGVQASVLNRAKSQAASTSLPTRRPCEERFNRLSLRRYGASSGALFAIVLIAKYVHLTWA